MVWEGKEKNWGAKKDEVEEGEKKKRIHKKREMGN